MESERLDGIFDALANEHRRAIVHGLSLHPHTISQLAAMRELSLPAMHKHLSVLERGGLVMRKKIGRTTFLAINRRSLRDLQDWIQQYHPYWGNDEETLENYVDYLKGERGSKL